MGRTRVYVAGAYSSDNVMGVLENMRKGMRISTDVLVAGYAPFCPWLDYQFNLMLRDNESLTINDFYEYSMSWLDVSDVVLVVPGWENSKGTITEIERAEQQGIPVYYSLELLKKDVPVDLNTTNCCKQCNKKCCENNKGEE